MVEGDGLLGFLRWWARATAEEASCVSLCRGGECGAVVVKREMGMGGAAEIEDERERKREMSTMQCIVSEMVSIIKEICRGRYSS